MINTHSRPKQRGYILIMTLFLLAMSATTLLTLAVESHRRARQALLVQENLQKRWGTLTAERALLPLAPDLLKTAALRLNQPTSRTAFTLMLGGQRFVMILSDEQAKANANAFGATVDTPTAEAIAKTLLPDPAVVRFLPAKRTRTAKDGTKVTENHFATFGQLFSELPPAMLMGNGASPGLADQLTCWGDGKLNLEAATGASLVAICSLDLNRDQLARLRETCEQFPMKSADELLGLQRFSKSQRATLDKRFAKTSKCVSLWIAADVDGRPTYRFVVRADGKPPEIAYFTW